MFRCCCCCCCCFFYFWWKSPDWLPAFRRPAPSKTNQIKSSKSSGGRRVMFWTRATPNHTAFQLYQEKRVAYIACPSPVVNDMRKDPAPILQSSSRFPFLLSHLRFRSPVQIVVSCDPALSCQDLRSSSHGLRSKQTFRYSHGDSSRHKPKNAHYSSLLHEGIWSSSEIFSFLASVQAFRVKKIDVGVMGDDELRKSSRRIGCTFSGIVRMHMSYKHRGGVQAPIPRHAGDFVDASLVFCFFFRPEEPTQ